MPPKAQLSQFQTEIVGSAAEQARIRSINAMFGGSADRFQGKEEAYDDVCDVLNDYIEVVEQVRHNAAVDRTEITQEAMLHCKEILMDHFPFCAEAYRVLAIVFLNEKLYDKAIRCCDFSIECYEATDPEFTSEAVEMEWGYVEQRPYMRTLYSKAMCLEGAGRYEKAKTMYQKLLRLNPGDNLGCRHMLFYLCLRIGDLDVAELMSKENKKESSASFLWGDVLLKFLHWQLDHIDKDKLDSCLAKAIDQNLFVPDLLLSTDPLPPLPTYISYGSKDEAISVTNGINAAWKSVDGINEFLESAMYQGGRKPTSSKEMFDLLARRNVLVRTSTGLETIMTTCVSTMMGNGLEEFTVPTGTKNHVECAPMVMFDNGKHASWREVYFVDIV